MNRTSREVLQLLRMHGRISRVQLATELGLTRMAIGSTVEALLKAGIIEIVGMSAATSRGRPSEIFQVTGKGLYCFGMAVGVFTIHMVILDWFNNTVAEKRIDNVFTQKTDDPLSATETVLAAMDELLAEAGVSHVNGGAIAYSADEYDVAGKRIVAVNDFLSVDQANAFLDRLKNHMGVPIWLERDVDAALLAERWSTRNLPLYPNLFYMNDRLGFAMMLDGRPWRGPADASRWMARVQVDPHGAAIPGFPNGSLYHSSLQGMIDRRQGFATGCRPAHMPRITQLDIQQIFDLYEKRDSHTVAEIHRSFEDVAKVVCNMVAMFSFDTIVLDGWTPTILKDGINIVQRAISQNSTPQNPAKTIVRAANLGESQEAIGAGISSIDHLLSSRQTKITSAAKRRGRITSTRTSKRI